MAGANRIRKIEKAKIGNLVVMALIYSFPTVSLVYRILELATIR